MIQQTALRWLRLPLGVLPAVLAACTQSAYTHTGAQSVAPAVPDQSSSVITEASGGSAGHALLGHGKIKHVVIVFQENRTPDNLFNGFPGADTVKSGLNTAGAQVPLLAAPLAVRYDISHAHEAFSVAFDSGEMDGFNLEPSLCWAGRLGCPTRETRAYGYVPKSETKPYFSMASQYAFGAKMFASNSGPSYPAHQYILSGTSTISAHSSLRAAENPLTPDQKDTGGCDSPTGSLVFLIDNAGAEEQQVAPCLDRPALSDLVNAKHLTWHWYQAHGGAGLWNGPDAVRHIRYGSQFSTNVTWPPSRIFTDIKNGKLANVVWVIPTAKASDHAGDTDGTGPSWVASVVNAVGRSKYWDSTAIFVTWDDWGGWYDHVKPPQYNSYELGFRVPLIVVGAYVKKGCVSTKQHEFGSILKFTEQAMGLGSLGATDKRADNLSDCFDFSMKARKFVKIQSPYGSDYFLRQPVSNQDPDSN